MSKVKLFMKELRTKAIEARRDRHDITLSEIKVGIKHTRNNRSLGGDFWSPKEVKNLEDPHINSLKDIINESER